MDNLHHMRFDFVSPDALEVAERVIRDLDSPFAKRAFRGAHEWMLTKKGEHTGAGARNTAANERTASERRELNDMEMRARIGGRSVAAEDRAPFLEAIERAEESEAAARAGVGVAAEAMSSAKVIFNKMVLRLFDSAKNGEVLRPKKVSVRKGNPSSALGANTAEQSAKITEAEPVRNAMEPLAVLKEQLGRQVDELLAKDASKVNYAGGEARWTHPVRTTNDRHEIAGHYITVDDLLPLIVSLHADEIKKRLFDRVDRDFAGDESLRLTKEEKRTRLAKARAEILELQYEEAALRAALAGDSPEIAFRPQMDPLATLGLEVLASDTPKRVLTKASDAVTDALAHIGIQL